MKKKVSIGLILLLVLALMTVNSILNEDTKEETDLTYTKDKIIELFEVNILYFDKVVDYISSYEHSVIIYKDNDEIIAGRYDDSGDIIVLEIEDDLVTDALAYILNDLKYISIYGDSSYIEFHRHTFPGPYEENTTPSQEEVGILYKIDSDEGYNYGLTEIDNNWYYYSFGFV